MLRHLGIESRLQLAITVCVIALIAVTTMGGSGGAPWVFFTYRSLLLVITILCAIGSRAGAQRISPVFIGLTATSLILMLLSVLRIQGSHFEGFYLWYKHAFYISALLALALYSRLQSARWKGLLLTSLVLLNLAYLIPAIFSGPRPIAGFSTNNVNYFGTFLLIGLAGSMAIAVFGIDWRWRAAAAFSAALLFFGISQTWSRGALLAAVVIIALSAVRSGPRIPRRAWIFIGVAAFVTVIVASPYLAKKFLDRGESDPYNYARTQIWINSLPIIAEHPFLGAGFGQYVNVSKRYAFPVEGQVARYLKRAQMAHSEYLQRIAESGIPAAVLLFSLFGYLLYLAWKRAERVWPEYRCFQEAAILTMVGLGTHALVDNCWTIPVMASGIVAMSLADLLPLEARPPKKWKRSEIAVAVLGFAALYVPSTLIPGMGLYYNDFGHQAYNKADYNTAEKYHQAAIRMAPDNPLFLDNLGMVYLQKFDDTRQYELLRPARQYFAKAIASAPLSLDPYILMDTAILRSMTGDLQKDRKLCDLYIVNAKGLLNIDPYIPFVRKNLAQTYYRLGQQDKAFQELKQAIGYEPNYVPGYLTMAMWDKELGKTSESELYTKTAIAIANKYKQFKPREPYEGLLLGRPEDSFPHTK